MTGEVGISCHVSVDDVSISRAVDDEVPTGFRDDETSTGFPDDDVDRPFESGYTTAPDGTGLGLAIIEHIATAHGWEIRATTGTDGGARIAFLTE